VLNPEATTYDLQVKVGEVQNELVAAGVLDDAALTFKRDHVFDNWTAACRTISGEGQYSGGYHWQLLSNGVD
jgi:hypothetical protein